MAVVVGAVLLALTIVLQFVIVPKWVAQVFGERPTIPTAQLGGTGPGSLLSANPMPALMAKVGPGKLQAARVTYRSTSGDGKPTVVSGAVVAPLGAAPQGGWPVISYGHGTTGIDKSCAPSLSDTLLGSIDVVRFLVSKGFAVALADYQGLGSDGIHGYPDSRTAGLNMIDAVRALRKTFKEISTRWAAVGGSQGGGAAWAADEQAGTYAPELNIVGAVAVSPAADVSGLVDKADVGALTREQAAAFQAIVESVARLHPQVRRVEYRRGSAAMYWDALLSCSGPGVAARALAYRAMNPRDFGPTTAAAADRLRRVLQKWALPQQRLTAPLLVWYGGADVYIDAEWTTAAIQRACAMGGTVARTFEQDKGHGEVDWTEQFKWVVERFADKPVISDCA
jgi:pimeloyl-ACP methyl ester carboxylesterase